MNTNLPVRRMKERQHFDGTIPDILMRLTGRFAFRLPSGSRVGHGRERSGLVAAPDRQSQTLAQKVSLFDQLFLAWVSGSVTRTVPLLRLRTTVPVSHQVRTRCGL